MVLSALALWVAWSGQERVATLSLESPALQVTALLQRLERATGEPHEAAAGLGERWLAVRAEDVSSEEVRSRLAHVLLARWEKEGSTHRLVVDSDVRRQAVEEGITRRAAELRRWIDDLAKKSPPSAPMTPTEAGQILDMAAGRARYRPLAEGRSELAREQAKILDLARSRSPLGRAASRILASLTDDDLRSLRTARTVFSTQPNRLQRPLPASVSEVLVDFARDQGVFASRAEGRGPSGGEAEPELMTGRLETPPEVALLVVTHTQGVFQFRVRFADRSGRVLADWRAATVDDTALPPPSTDADPVLDLPEEHLALAAWTLGDTEDRKRYPKRPEWFEPDRVEPHAGGIGAVFVALAKSQGKPLLAILDDTLLYRALAAPKNRVLRSQAEALVAQNPRLEDGAWLLFGDDAQTMGAPPVPRTALRRFVDGMRAQGTLTLTAASELAGQLPNDLEVFPDWAQFLCGLADCELPSYELAPLRFWREMTPTQRATARQGKPLPIASWTAGQRRVFADALASPTLDQALQALAEVDFEVRVGWATSLLSEPTILLAQGIPHPTSVLVSAGDGLWLVTSGGPEGRLKADATSLASALAEAEATGRDPYGVRTRTFSILKVEDTTFEFRLGSVAGLSWGLSSERRVRSSASLADLPANEQAAFRSALAAARAERGGATGRPAAGGSGGTIRP